MTASDSKKILICTSFLHAGGKSPNAKTFTDQQKFRVYHRCICVYFWTLRQVYPEATLRLYVDAKLPSLFADLLEKWQVETKTLHPHFAGGAIISNSFPGCLYALDAMADLKKESAGRFQKMVLMDNDCLARMFAPQLASSSDQLREVWALQESYPTTQAFNGQSRASLTLAAGYLTGTASPDPIPIYGGEFFAFDPAGLEALWESTEIVWSWICGRGRGVLGNEWTEEHVISLAMHLAGLNPKDARPMIRRIWTLENYRNVQGNEHQLPFWHLPGEKRRGLQKIYRKASRRTWQPFPRESDLQKFLDSPIQLNPGRTRSLFRKASFRIKKSLLALEGKIQ